MNLNNNRTVALLAVALVAVVMILNPNWLVYALGIVQSIVIIVLGIVATVYLWKRL